MQQTGFWVTEELELERKRRRNDLNRNNSPKQCYVSLKTPLQTKCETRLQVRWKRRFLQQLSRKATHWSYRSFHNSDLCRFLSSPFNLITWFGFIQCISLNVHRLLPSKYEIVFSRVHGFIAEQLNRYLHAFISKIVEMGETCRDKPRNQVLPWTLERSVHLFTFRIDKIHRTLG